jgi:hypothetical protein
MDQNRISPAFQRKLVHALQQRADPEWIEDLRLCLPIVLELLVDQHDRPTRPLAPAIRAVIRDRCVIGARERRFGHEALEQHVELLILELEKLRDIQIRRGDWSESNTPPQMFG